jgi:hypothetical protein
MKKKTVERFNVIKCFQICCSFQERSVFMHTISFKKGLGRRYLNGQLKVLPKQVYFQRQPLVLSWHG